MTSSKPVRLVLVRHGLTDWNEQGRLLGWEEIGLNSRGREQAQAAARALHGLPLQGVYASPQLRAQETAAILAEANNLEVNTEPGLAEVWLGRWCGKTWEEIKDDPDLQRSIADAMYECDAVEPVRRVRERVVEVVERLREQGNDKWIACVSHGDPLRILVASYVGLDLPVYRRLQIDTGSISVLRLDERGARLMLLNWKPTTRVREVIGADG